MPLRETQLSPVEIRATAALDVALHPSEPEAAYLEHLQARMLGQNPDALRLHEPRLRARNHRELSSRLAGLVRRVEANETLGVTGEAEAQAVASMLGALSSLADIQDEIDATRKGYRR